MAPGISGLIVVLRCQRAQIQRHAGDPVVGYVVAVNPDRQTCVVLFGDTSVGRDVSVCSLIVLPTVASEPIADAAALGSSEDLETTRRYQTVGDTSVGHDVPSTGLVAKPTAGALGPAADRDAPGSAGDPKGTRGGRTPWICCSMALTGS